MIDQITFYLFISGLFKDHRTAVQNYWYFPMFALAAGLIFERKAINWLSNRSGCTYSKFQKFIEMDMRKKAIKENWTICPPEYNPKGYKPHYFRPDFKDLLERFEERPETADDERRKLRDN